jgi:hypothetical protein
MAVRNIERGYYELPLLQVMLNFTGIYSKTVTCHVEIVNSSTVIIKIPPFSDIATTAGTLTATLPPEYQVATSSNVISQPMNVNIGGAASLGIFDCNVSSGLITIYADINRSPFQINMPAISNERGVYSTTLIKYNFV